MRADTAYHALGNYADKSRGYQERLDAQVNEAQDHADGVISMD